MKRKLNALHKRITEYENLYYDMANKAYTDGNDTAGSELMAKASGFVVCRWMVEDMLTGAFKR